MGFSIGKFFKSIAAPVIGAVVGGPIGAVLGAGVSAAFNGGRPSQVGPSAGFRAPAVTQLRAGFGGGSVGGLLAGAAVSLISQLLGTARQNTGQAVSVQKVIDAVRVCGIAQAAAMFGLSETEICQIVISKRRRRARGISAVDLRRTRATIRKVHNISHDLRALAPAARAHRVHHR